MLGKMAGDTKRWRCPRQLTWLGESRCSTRSSRAGGTGTTLKELLGVAFSRLLSAPAGARDPGAPRGIQRSGDGGTVPSAWPLAWEDRCPRWGSWWARSGAGQHGPGWRIPSIQNRASFPRVGVHCSRAATATRLPRGGHCTCTTARSPRPLPDVPEGHTRTWLPKSSNPRSDLRPSPGAAQGRAQAPSFCHFVFIHSTRRAETLCLKDETSAEKL